MIMWCSTCCIKHEEPINNAMRCWPRRSYEAMRFDMIMERLDQLESHMKQTFPVVSSTIQRTDPRPYRPPFCLGSCNICDEEWKLGVITPLTIEFSELNILTKLNQLYREYRHWAKKPIDEQHRDIFNNKVVEYHQHFNQLIHHLILAFDEVIPP